MNTHACDTLLPALLGTLLPGHEGWPAAAATHVVTYVAARATQVPELARAFDAVCAVLPSDFAHRDLDARTVALGDAEARLPESFTAIVTEAYRGYYTDAHVLALIERKTGDPARPPQPLGRTVRPADWSVLAARAITPAPLPALLEPTADPRDS